MRRVALAAVPLVAALSVPFDDAYYMRLALEQARLAEAAGEVPVGAVVVNGSGVVEARSFNQVEMLADASAHAELLGLRQAAGRRRNWRLLDATLYCTLEPCAICLSSIYAFRVKRVVYAAPDLRLGAVQSWIQLPEHRHPFHSVDIQAGVCQDQAAALLKDFFIKRRRGANEQRIGAALGSYRRLNEGGADRDLNSSVESPFS